MRLLNWVSGLVVAGCFLGSVTAQSDKTGKWLDPTRGLSAAQSDGQKHVALPEQYVWTADDAAVLQSDHSKYRNAAPNVKAEPRYFRTSFLLKSLPAAATLYVAGVRSEKVYINGELLDEVSSDLSHPLGMHVFSTDVKTALRLGQNTLALEVARGRGIVSISNSLAAEQQAFGEVLVAKIVAAAMGENGPTLVMSGPDWKSTLNAAPGWQAIRFDDAAWKNVQALGGIESSIDLFQWSADAGLYDWPGYDGISPFLRHYGLKPAKVSRLFEGRSRFVNVGALTAEMPDHDFVVKMASSTLPSQSAPSLMLDFGREVAGRLAFQSACDCQAVVEIQYGESENEAEAGGHYLGTNLLRVPRYATAYGPKSGFRYAKVRFVGGAPELHFKSVQLDGIYYPVEYRGSFESSDELLDRIWETGAHTMHLCMQDDIWDAPKRDRGRWVGDLDVGGRVVNSVFADHFLMEDTMTRLIGDSPVNEHVNGIPGYSSLWITSLADYYRHTGAKEYLASVRGRMVELLKLMDSGFDKDDAFVNPTKAWLFVDWSPDLFADTPEARRATQIEYYRAYLEGAYLLRQLGDTATAEHYEQRAEQIKKFVNQRLLDPQMGTYGLRWQTNAMAVFSGLATPDQYLSIWNGVLKSVRQDQPESPVISPYYNYYVVSAMAKMGHRAEGLKWVREYWGGMLDEGATSFWEAYDLRWPKNRPHVSLQADGTSGYFVSLAHGWSSGPTAWLMEQVLGISPTDAGFSRVNIRPDLIDLSWAKGTEPTPYGPINVSLTKDTETHISLDLPGHVNADVLVPIASSSAKVSVNGNATTFEAMEGGTRAKINLDHKGHFEIRAE